MSEPFPLIALRRRHAQTLRDSSFSYKIDYVIVIKTFLNSEGHQNRISYGHFSEGVDFAYWWSFISGGSAINGATPSILFSKEKNERNKYMFRLI